LFIIKKVRTLQQITRKRTGTIINTYGVKKKYRMGDGMHITAIWDRLSSDDTASSLDPGLLLHHRSTWSRYCAPSAWRCRSSQWLAPWPSPARAACMCTRKIYIGMAYIHTYIESRSIGFIFILLPDQSAVHAVTWGAGTTLDSGALLEVAVETVVEQRGSHFAHWWMNAAVRYG